MAVKREYADNQPGETAGLVIGIGPWEKRRSRQERKRGQLKVQEMPVRQRVPYLV